MMTNVVKTEVVKRGPTALVKRGRPPKALEVAGVKTMPDRIKTIAEYHRAAESSACQAVLYAILCGMELIAARKEVPKGDWLTWVQVNCPFEQRTAYKYEEAAKRKAREIPQLLKMRAFVTGVAPSLMAEKDRLQLVAFIQDATDGDTLGSILGKTDRTYDHIGGNAKLREWLAEHYPESKVRAVEDLAEKQRKEWDAFQDGQRAEAAARKNVLDRNAWTKAISEVMNLANKRKYAILTRGEIEHSAALLQDIRNKLLEALRK